MVITEFGSRPIADLDAYIPKNGGLVRGGRQERQRPYEIACLRVKFEPLPSLVPLS